jgi:O-antigen/teichoic acid export membrane protein
MIAPSGCSPRSSDSIEPLGGSALGTLGAVVAQGTLSLPVPRQAASRLQSAAEVGSCIADQAIYSSTHFAVALGLGRLLPPEQYGAFSAAYTVFLLLLILHYGLILEPFTYYAATKYRDVLSAYLRTTVVLNVILSPAMALVVLFAGVSVHSHGGQIVVGSITLAVVSPLLLVAYTLRRALYVLGAGFSALVASAAYMSGTFLGAFVLWRYKALDAGSVFAALGLGGAASAAVAAVRLRRLLSGVPTAESRVSLRIASADHRRYGRWSTASMLVNSASTSSYILIFSLSNLTAAAHLRAIDNLFLPLPQFFTALSILLLPRLAALRFRNDTASASRLLRGTTLGALLAVLLYLSPLLFFGKRVVHFLYHQPAYDDCQLLVLLMCVVAIARVISNFSVGLFFRASNTPRTDYKIQRSGGVATVLIGLPLCWHFGLPGAVTGRIITASIELLASLYYLKTHALQRHIPERPL